MSYVAPNTVIRLLDDVPLDNTYEHTVYFSSPTQRDNYWITKTRHLLQRQSYQRVNSNTMRVNIKADDLYTCNYLMFQNTAFGNKWFYAFITRVDYVNNVTSEVEYEMDVMQTWMFDYTLDTCFVEREHSKTDAVGDNLVPESVIQSDYEDFIEGQGLNGVTKIQVCASFDENYEATGGLVYNGLYSGINYTRFDNTTNGISALKTFLLNVGTKADGIVAIGLVPEEATTGDESSPHLKSVSITKRKDIKRADGTAVHNNKLYTYPYNYLHVYATTGESNDYKYEYFNNELDDNCTFTVEFDNTPQPSAQAVPRNYQGVNKNLQERVNLGSFPQLPYTTDAYRAWLAQNQDRMVAQLINSGFNSFASLSKGNAMGATSTLSTIVGQMFESNHAKKQPDKVKGSSSNTILASHSEMNIYFYNRRIKPQFATIIDDFFDKFGYRCMQLKVPNTNARPYWTYTKTVSCTITGSVPANDMNKICKIYDNGITFWNGAEHVGNYTLDNRIGA